MKRKVGKQTKPACNTGVKWEQQFHLKMGTTRRKLWPDHCPRPLSSATRLPNARQRRAGRECYGRAVRLREHKHCLMQRPSMPRCAGGKGGAAAPKDDPQVKIVCESRENQKRMEPRGTRDGVSVRCGLNGACHLLTPSPKECRCGFSCHKFERICRKYV
jgi:hypothetical protein